jgi:hypothetical protein
LKYAAGRIANIRTWKSHYEVAEDLLIQAARVEAGALPVVLNTILRQPATDDKCWGCHQQIAKTFTSDRLEVLVEYIERDEPIAWVPVAQVPDFVHFTHRPHVAAGLNCETCHGDMSTMEIAENQQVLNMGWCLQCHKSRTEDNVENNPENDQHVSELLHEKRTKLMDCGTCHY